MLQLFWLNGKYLEQRVALFLSIINIENLYHLDSLKKKEAITNGDISNLIDMVYMIFLGNGTE